MPRQVPTDTEQPTQARHTQPKLTRHINLPVRGWRYSPPPTDPSDKIESNCRRLAHGHDLISTTQRHHHDTHSRCCHPQL